MSVIDRNILAITLYRIFSRMYFYLPILFPFFYLSGQSVQQIELLLALYGVSTALAITIAKKIVGNIGHKKALLIGEILKIVSLLIFIFFHKYFFMLALAQIFMGIGYAMIVSNDTVILQQTFKGKQKNRCSAVQIKTNSYLFLSLLFSGLLGALFFKYSPSLVMWISILAAIFSFFSILSMIYAKENNTLENRKVTLPVDNTVLIYYCFIRGMIIPVFIGGLPYFFFIIKKTDMIWFGAILSSFTLSGFFSSKYFVEYFKKYRIASLFIGSLALICFAYLLLLFGSLYLGLLTTILLGFLAGSVRPLAILNINTKKFDIEKTLNRAEFFYGLLSSLLLIFAGLFFKYSNFNDYIYLLVMMSFITGFIFIFQTKEKLYENSFEEY